MRSFHTTCLNSRKQQTSYRCPSQKIKQTELSKSREYHLLFTFCLQAKGRFFCSKFLYQIMCVSSTRPCDADQQIGGVTWAASPTHDWSTSFSRSGLFQKNQVRRKCAIDDKILWMLNRPCSIVWTGAHQARLLTSTKRSALKSVQRTVFCPFRNDVRCAKRCLGAREKFRRGCFATKMYAPRSLNAFA